MEVCGSPFAAADLASRQRSLRAFVNEEAVDVRDAADALFAFTYGGMYSEWTGFDRDRRVLEPPPVWGRMGYGGPSIGYPDFAEPSALPNENEWAGDAAILAAEDESAP
jgi:hypothetical protein